MLYKGSWRHTSGLRFIVLLLAAVGAAVALLEPALWIFPACAVAWLASLRLLWIRLDDDGIIYHDWFGTHRAMWSELRGVLRTEDLPFPRNRLYGPFSYELRTADNRFVVNLLYFPREMSSEFGVRTASFKRRRGGTQSRPLPEDL